MADFPRKAWFIEDNGNGKHREVTLLGETSRSWLVGNPWRPVKLAKKGLLEITEEHYGKINGEWQWWLKHRDAIVRQISYSSFRNLPPAVLRQIAELIGYKEGDDANR